MTNAEFTATLANYRKQSQRAQLAEIQAILSGDIDAAKRHRHTAETFAGLAGPAITDTDW